MLNGAKNITFEKCELSNNNNFGWSFIEALNNSNILLDKCTIKNNSQTTDQSSKFDKVVFFNTMDYSGVSDSVITIKDSEISNNNCDYLADNKASVKLDNCTLSNNTWK